MWRYPGFELESVRGKKSGCTQQSASFFSICRSLGYNIYKYVGWTTMLDFLCFWFNVWMNSIYACTFLAKIAKVVKDTKITKRTQDWVASPSLCMLLLPARSPPYDRWNCQAGQLLWQVGHCPVLREEVILIVFNIDEQVNREAKIKVVSMSPALLL